MAQTITALTSTTGLTPLYSSFLGGANGYIPCIKNVGGTKHIYDTAGTEILDNTDLANIGFNSLRIHPNGDEAWGVNGASFIKVTIPGGVESTVKTFGTNPDDFGGGEGDFDEAGNRLPYLRTISGNLNFCMYDIGADAEYSVDVSSEGTIDAAYISASGTAGAILSDTQGHILYTESGGTLTKATNVLSPVTAHNTTSARMPDGTDAFVCTTIAWSDGAKTGYTGGEIAHHVVAVPMTAPGPTNWSEYTKLLSPPDIGWGDSVLCHGRGTDVIVQVYSGSAFKIWRCHTDGRAAVELVSESDLSPWTYWESGFASLDVERKKVYFGYDQGSGLQVFWVNVGLVDGTYSLR